MSIAKETKGELISKFRNDTKDTGSTGVQVALLTEQINLLTAHMKIHSKDFHSKRGLTKLVGQRRRLLEYMKRTDEAGYVKLIKELKLRK